MKRIDVAVGIIFDHHSRVLIGQRIVEDQYFRKWEFPGGKFEQGENAHQALARELAEELGIEVIHTEDFLLLEHDYPDRHVRLSVLMVSKYLGDVAGKEGQALQWVAPDELPNWDFLQGNQAIVERLLSLRMA